MNNVGSCNVFLPVQRQAIGWIDFDVLSIAPIQTIFYQDTVIFIQENIS